MKNIILQRTLDVRCWNVIGMVAKASKRPELMPVLLRVRERGETDASDVAAHLFFEKHSRRVVAERMLHIAERYGLVSQKEGAFTLTDAGAAALDADEVFVPERGNWTIWASHDPLLGHPVLRVVPWSAPPARDAMRRRDKENEEPVFVEVPRILRETRGRIVTPFAGDGSRLRIDELADKAEEVDPGATLRIVWAVNEGRVRIDGALGGAALNSVVDAPGIALADVWRQLLESEGLSSRWDKTREALLVGFDEADDSERESLLRALTIKEPTLAELGGFDETTVQDVPLHARGESDAAAWAKWRLLARARDYATAERFGRWSEDAIAPFAPHSPALPSRAQLADQAWRDRGERPSALTWHLVAAEDWRL